MDQAVKFMMGLYKHLLKKIVQLLKLIHLVVTGDGKVMALDAKLNFDSNALYRHKDIVELS